MERQRAVQSELMAAIKKAAAATRASDPLGATRILQGALGGGTPAPQPQPQPQAEPAPRARRPRLDPNAEIVEPLPRRSERMHKPLGEALRTLREGRGGFARQRPGGRVPPPEVPDGARFETRDYASAAGSRSFRLYVPRETGAPLRGLVLMLHGCTQNPDDFAAGTGMNALAETHRLVVAYPGQTAAENSSSCWNWFRPRDQRRGAGEPALLAGLAEALAAEFGIADGQVFVAGLSAGGAMAAVLGEAYPDVFAAVGIHSGLPAGAANDVLSAFAAMRGEAGLARPGTDGVRPRTIVFHGSADATVHAVNGERIVAAAGGAGTEESRGAAAGGRSYLRRVRRGPDGVPATEHWTVEGAGHAWSGGKAPGTYVDPAGPDASAEMVRFFLEGAPSGRGAGS
jgi:poly(hydroxyalkanoate) depolymerase family esterase